MKRLVVVLAGLAGCGDSSVPIDPGPAGWQIVLDDTSLDRAVLSSWGLGANSVFFAGGSLGNGGPALALHHDGSRFVDLAPGGEDSFWWVSGTGPSDVWFVGENGRIAHHDGQGFVAHDSGTSATLYGVWAFSPSDVWAVGEGDLVLHHDGESWASEDLPGEPRGFAHFKVWGPSADDLYVVGEGGTIWHRRGGSWALEPAPPTALTLTTVYGCSSSEVYAVGGLNVLRSDGNGSWQQAIDPAALNSIVNGVSCAGPGQVTLAGGGGLKQRLVAGQWIDEFTIEPYGDFHATWMAGPEEIWVVGGDFVSPPSPGSPRPGLIGRYGRGELPHAIE